MTYNLFCGSVAALDRQAVISRSVGPEGNAKDLQRHIRETISLRSQPSLHIWLYFYEMSASDVL